MNAPRALGARYRGYHFRSRLEARWAVFFDHAGVRWTYEPEGYALASGNYLPDFWLPDLGFYEVKGPRPDDREERLAAELAVATGARVFIASGNLPFFPDPDGSEADGESRICVFGPNHYDVDYAWCVCPWCGAAGIEYNARGARIHGYRHHGLTEAEAMAVIAGRPNCWRVDDKCYTGDDPALLVSFAAARSARFEHGRSGAT